MGRSAIGLVAGVVAAAAVIVLSGGTMTPLVTLAAGIAFSGAAMGAQMLLGQPKTNSAQEANAQNLQMSNSSEAYAIPVIFGTQRLAGNFLRYEKSEFRNEKITEEVEAGAGKGGSSGSGSQTVGYRYFLSFEYGICMGPVDFLHQVTSNPGEFEMLENDRVLNENAEEITLRSPSREEQGDVKIYRGTATQNREDDAYSDDGMNYRNICWAYFDDFEIGRQPVPKSYLFEITRWPDIDGTGIEKKGSNNDEDAAYWSANPAAILYEIFTNKIWGRGLDPDLIDVQSFRDAADYFISQKIGLSFALDGQNSLADVVDSVRMHVNTIVIEVGGRLYCRCLMDTTNSYAHTIEINASHLGGDPELTRPMWPSTYNEIRCEFNCRTNRFQSEVALAQDLGNIQTIGIINSKKIGLRGFIDRQAAQRAANRILRDLSYPSATLKLFINRFNSKLIPGDFVKFVWDEWSAGTTTSYWRVVTITDEAQDERGIEVLLIEDQFKPATQGIEDDFDLPIERWGDTEAVGDEVNHGEDAYERISAGDLSPAAVRELNIYMTQRTKRYAVFAERRVGAVLAFEVFRGIEDSGDLVDAGNLPCWAITGVLDSLPGDVRQVDRSVSVGGILNHEPDKTDLLEACTIVTIPADHFDPLTKKTQCLLIVEDEIIQVGYAIDNVGPNVIFKNMIRGCYGTPVQEHTGPIAFIFVVLYTTSHYTQAYTSAIEGSPLDWTGYGVVTDGLDLDSEVTMELPTGDHAISGKAMAPFPPNPRFKTVVGADWEIEIRPRFHNQGAGVGPFEDTMEFETTSLDGQSFLLRPDTMASGTVSPSSTTLDASTGIVTLTYPAAGVSSFKVWSKIGTQKSVDFVTI